MATTTASPSSAKEDPSPSPSPPSASTNPTPNPNPNPNPNPDPNPNSNPDPSTDPLPPPSAPPPPNSTNPRRLPPPCWTHEETLALIESYREKWHALRRGNLRANHWQEVADGVARCASGGAKPKTAVQCRHKVEKLRKRYRSERQRCLRANPINPPVSSWVYFSKMDAMEAGSTGSARPKPPPPPPPSFSDDDDNGDGDGDDEEDDDDVNGNPSNTRSLHGLMSKANNGVAPAAAITGLRFRIPKAVRTKVGGSNAVAPKPNYLSGNGFSRGFPEGRMTPAAVAAEEMRKRLEKRRRREREGDLVGEMVAAVRMLGDGFVRTEEMKMEVAREMEKLRMEMELKRTEMILESQRRFVDAFVRGIRGKKRARGMPESS